MLKNLKTGLVIMGLAFPLITHSSPNLSRDGEEFREADISFINIPTFSNLCTGSILPGLYTIRNNTPAWLRINYIQIQINDELNEEATALVTAPINPCMPLIGPGASCNILVFLQPQDFGNFNRVLQIGVDTRQVELNSPPILSSVNCALPEETFLRSKATTKTPLSLSPALSKVAVLASLKIKNEGGSFINGDVALSPGSEGINISSKTVINGNLHATDATASAVQAEAKTYYHSAVKLSCPAENNLSGQNLGGKVLAPGIYCFEDNAELNGSLTLQGNSTSAYVFKIGSTLSTAPHSSVVLKGGVSNANVTWAVGNYVTIEAGTVFAGIIDAVKDVQLRRGSSLQGKAWSQLGAVSLNNNVVNSR
ncbi:MAG: DUF3494 domain-containing protein [Tatlockia sp.]|nr:DUF3494 domain-containing protein [Tatlockia sp.]